MLLFDLVLPQTNTHGIGPTVTDQQPIYTLQYIFRISTQKLEMIAVFSQKHHAATFCLVSPRTIRVELRPNLTYFMIYRH